MGARTAEMDPMEKFHQDGAEELLQQFLQSADTTTEFLFLDSLFRNPATCRDKPKHPDSNLSNGVDTDKNGEDVSVCDIEITLSCAEVDDQNCTCGKELEPAIIGKGNGSNIAWRDQEGRNIDSKLQHVSCSSACALHNQNSVNSLKKHTSLSNSQAASALVETLSLWQLNNGGGDICDTALVEKCVQYVFERRFGPVDQNGNGNSAVPVHSDPKVVVDLNRRLDTVMKRMMDLPVSAELVSAYTAVLQRASGMPTMRKKLLEHVMLWLSRRRTSLDEATFKYVKVLVLAGLSDVWSAVRKTCSAGVGRLFKDWSPSQQESLFTRLLEICIDKEGSWQSKDGSALCIHAVIHSCFPPSIRSKEEGEDLPSYLVECVLTIVFSLISHPQTSIRETVTRIMSSYMEHVDLQDMMDLMHQTLTLLTPPTTEAEKEEECVHCVEAYAAEGLLNICTSIVKVLPVRKTVQVWMTHCKAFLAYLAHDASSVRQTSSTLLMHVATHRESSAVLMKLVMYHLMRDWSVSEQSLASCHHFLQEVAEDKLSWEGKEGRMFVYELLCKHLTECHCARSQEDFSAVTLHTGCSQDGGSEAEETMDQCYKSVSGYMARQSLVTQLILLDNPDQLADEVGIQVLREDELQNLQRWLLGPHSCASGRYSDDVSPGSEKLWLPSCGDLLMGMFHHTAVCLAHPQWELRRIAQQVLPCLCEVMCLYDVELTMRVWGYMAEDANLLSFLGLFSLHHSLSLCARVVATADLTAKVSTITNPIYVDFMDGVRRHMESYLPLLCRHLHREAYDKMSVVAAETALLALNFFDLQQQIQEELCSGVVCLWRELFSFAHPKSAITTSLFPAPQHPFHSPYDGFLSCCLVRPESDAQCAKQVEKSLMLAIHKHLPHFLPQLDGPLAAHCLPLLAHNIGLFIHDSDVCKSLTTSFNTLCQCTKKSFANMARDVSDSDMNDRDMSLKCVYFTIRELTAVIALKGLDVALLQKILACYLMVCESLQPETHIPLLLQGVSARLSDSGFHVDHMEGGGLDVTLCWNRPQLPPGFGQLHTSLDEDSLDHVSFTEENASDSSLNRSGSSSLGLQMYSRTGRRRTLSTTDDVLEIREMAARLSPRGKGEGQKEEEGDEEQEEEEQEEEEEESDWDSWSEEEADEELSTLQSHFQEFFQRLGELYGAAGQKIINASVSKLGSKEKELLKNLLT